MEMKAAPIADGPAASHPHASRAGSTLALCLLATMLDGIDMQAMALVSARVMSEWKLGSAVFGIVLSAAPLGMILGAIVLGPLADRVGRRPVMLWSMLALGSATLLAAASRGVAELVLLRALAGAAMGGIVPNAITLAVEVTPVPRRPFAAALVFGGVPMGGALAAATAVGLLDGLGWRTMFLLWGLLPLALGPILFLRLPESPAMKGPRGAKEQAGGGLSQVIAVRGWGRTFSLWLGLTLAFQATYFFAFWLPTVLQSAGLGHRASLASLIFLNGGAIPGTFILGALMTRKAPRSVVPAAYVAAAACAIATVFVVQSGLLLALFSFALGFLTFGGQVATAALIASAYPAAHRGAGVGWATGMGRIGAVTGPVLGGLLVSTGIQLVGILVLVAALQLVVAGLLRAGSAPMTKCEQGAATL